MNRRRHARHPFNMLARLRSEAGETLCVLLDLSLSGARMEGQPAPREGQSGVLHIFGHGDLAFDVQWRDDKRLGVSFAAKDQIERLKGLVPEEAAP